MPNPDLRILALADAKVLPPEIQSAFDHWRIWRARDAVVALVRKRITGIESSKSTAEMYLERLEQADSEQNIFEGIYALAEVIEVFRKQFGLHKDYIVLMMSGALNPWGLLSLQQDYRTAPASVVQAAQELWRLAIETHYDVETALKQITDETLAALEAYYAANSDSVKKTEST
jgi:hypothetical protein